MSFVEKVRGKVGAARPRVSECVIYVRPVPLIADEKPDAGDEFAFKVCFDPTDRHLAQLETPERLELMKGPFARGAMVILAVHVPTDRAIGKMWLITRTPESGDGSRGLLPIHLAKDECFLFDLWVHKDFRRHHVGITMAFEMGAAFDRFFPELRWVYGYAHKDNTASRNLMELFYGMWPVQEIKEVEVGPYWVGVVPGSDHPKFGPFSRRGRHSGDGFEMPGRVRSGEGYRDYHHKEGFARFPVEFETSDGWMWPGPDWFDNDHVLDAEGRPALPETLERPLD